MSAARGKTLPMVSKPSTLKNFMPPTRRNGKNTMATKAIPRPPNQFSMPRQSRNPEDMVSTLGTTEEPVVVIPDVASNIASVHPRYGSPSMKGIAPNTATAIHVAAVIRKVWRIERSPAAPSAVAIVNIAPVKEVRRADRQNADQLLLPVIKSSAAGNSIAIPRATTINPTTCSGGRGSSIAPLVCQRLRQTRTSCCSRNVA